MTQMRGAIIVWKTKGDHVVQPDGASHRTPLKIQKNTSVSTPDIRETKGLGYDLHKAQHTTQPQTSKHAICRRKSTVF
jgi:hypothetical protein